MSIRKIVLAAGAFIVLTGGGYGLASLLLNRGESPPDTAQSNDLPSGGLGLPLPAGTAGVAGSDYALGDRLPAAEPKRAAEFDPAFPELPWDDLIPPDWDPMAAFRGMNIAELQDNDPKAQEALDAMRKAWNDAPVNPQLAGRKVRIPGFAVPLEQSDRGVDEFLLVPYFGACIHTPPPPANQIIHVKLDKPEPAIGAMQAYWVWGELSTGKYNNEMGDAAYRIAAQGIQPYDD